MAAKWQDVLADRAPWSVERGDVPFWLDQLPNDSVDLCVFSPPYEAARTYGIDFNLRGQDWVDWMVKVFQCLRRVCKGLIACVCDGQTRDYRWSAVPALLIADLHRAGFHIRHPVCYAKAAATPGGGGSAAKHRAAGGSADWWRSDWEFIICTTRGGALPWADALACGHKPKWAPGGEFSNRKTNGERVNQWGGNHKVTGRRRNGTMNNSGDRPSHVLVKAGSSRRRSGNGEVEIFSKAHTKARANGDEHQIYLPPAIANPGNIIKCKVGGGQLGHMLAHENEAPYPLALVDRFVRCFCPPGGIVFDPFTGSGTTLHASILHGRRFIGTDIRQSQVKIARRRGESITPLMFGASGHG